MNRFVTGELYHIYNRGVEKRNIFSRESDYKRFFFSLDTFNDERPKTNTTVRFGKDYRSPTSIIFREKSKESLVEVKEFCLMPNHFHLLLEQVVDGGISKFMQKVGVGYTHYFNKKYERSGVLFQGKTKYRHVDSDAYLMWLERYIHLNPLDVVIPSFKKRGVKSVENTIKKLNEYKWVSCEDYNIYKEDLAEDINEILEDF